jgi:tetratricopeptide (TPR) repeat protein
VSTAQAPPPSVLAELCASDTEASRRAFIEAHPEVVNPEAVEALAAESRQQLRTDLRKALRASEAALTIAEKVGDPSSRGYAVRSVANVLWFRGDYSTAAELLDEAVKLFEQAGRRDEVGRTLSTSIQPLILLGQYGRALGKATEARRIFTECKDELRLARLEINVANIWHRQEHLDEALQAYQSAYEQLLPHGDVEALGVALHNMSVCLIGLDQFERALEVYENARAFLRAHNMPLLEAQANYNIAYLYYLRGDLQRALDDLRAAREVCTANNDLYHAALCDLDQSDIYLELNLVEEAARFAERAAKGFENLGIGYERARALTNLAIASSHLENTDKALDCFARARELFSRDHHRAGESLTDLYQAVLLAENGQTAEARRLCAAADAFFRAHKLVRKSVLCTLLLARIALSEGDIDCARSGCEEALSMLDQLADLVFRYDLYFVV